MKNLSALYIGRFQPFHLGHLDSIKQILEKEDHVLIAIGSAEKSFLPENPFTAGERFQMIRESLDEEGISHEKYDIIPIRNINNYALWVNHVELYCPPFSCVYTGSKIVKELFNIHGRHKVIQPKFNYKISATEVREKMIPSGIWEKLLPKAAEKLLLKINAEDRLREIQSSK